MLCAAVLASTAVAAEPPAPPDTATAPPAPLLEWRALEAAGARIGAIRIETLDVFATDDPQENNALFRAANLLHIQTRREVIERNLLFKPGDRLTVAAIDETERLLRSNRFLYDVRIEPVDYRDGVVDLRVATRDTWSLHPGISFSRAGGANNSATEIAELNLAGTGTRLSYANAKNIDRSGRTYSLGNDHTIDGWTAIKYSHAINSDGSATAGGIERPFYAMDTRWAAGLNYARDDRLDAIYEAGAAIARYRHALKSIEGYGGWATGRIDGWVTRYTAGLFSREHAYAAEPGETAPPALADDEKLRGLSLSYEIVEDDVAKVANRNQIGRPEYFLMGRTVRLGIERAQRALGSDRNAWTYTLKAGDGKVIGGDGALVGSVEHSLAEGDQRHERRRSALAATYFRPHADGSLFYAALSVDALRLGLVNEQLSLGGDNGLRGYPARYQNGDNRVLLTIEQRYFFDVFPFRLFRLGAAIFGDVGRAWTNTPAEPRHQPWLSDVGVGLRIASVRTAFGNVLHADLAAPTGNHDGIRKYQFLLRTRFSY